MSIKPARQAHRQDHAAEGTPGASPATRQVFAGQSADAAAQAEAKGREPDLVTAFFDVLIETRPELADMREEGEAIVRNRLKGLRGTVTNRPDGTTMQQRVLALFNGRNPREVARRLGVSRGTVYRHLKTSGLRD